MNTAGAPRKRNPAYTITQGAMIAALYVVLTMLSCVLGLTDLAVQFRF